MIVIRFMGGLGNQMFQYALYKKFENYTQILLKEGHCFKNHRKEITLSPKGKIYLNKRYKKN